MFNKFLSFYLHQLDKNPLKTKMMSGALVVGFGDLIAQRLSPHFKNYDPSRCFKMALYGFFISGGIGHLWFRALDRFFGKGMDVKSSLKKVCADQFILAPPEIAFFLAWSQFSGEHKQSLLEMLKKVMPELLVENYIIWIPTQFVNFYYVPEEHRVLFMCAVCVLWFAILSFTSHEFEHSSESLDEKNKLFKLG